MPNQSNLPKEYQDGWTEFLGCRIDLSKHPLIPRPETEFWTQKVIEAINNPAPIIPDRVLSVLDIFSGSGCVGIAVATRCPRAKVTLSDKKNYISTPISKNVKFIESDLFENIADKFDLILANPPYIPEGKGVGGIMEYEPHEALYAGKDGLDVIRLFLEQASERLNDGGQIWMEFGADQKESITNLLRDFNYYQNSNCTFHKDQYQVWRWVVISM